jgi:hypothetical protein
LAFQSASFLSATTDDDDISAFVQAIDARAPLNVRPVGGIAREESEETEMGAEQESGSGREEPASGADESGAPRNYRAHVDSELKRMNDAFVRSLAGLEGRPRRQTRLSCE